MIKIGKISSINPKTCTAKVIFEDEQNIVTKDLPIMVPFTLADKAYYMPKVNERVLCVFTNNSRSQGFILGSFYAQNREPTIQDSNVVYIQFEDGTSIKYDKNTKALDIDCVGEVTISAKEKITFKAPEFENIIIPKDEVVE